jgi:hypothetical protein
MQARLHAASPAAHRAPLASLLTHHALSAVYPNMLYTRQGASWAGRKGSARDLALTWGPPLLLVSVVSYMYMYHFIK